MKNNANSRLDLRVRTYKIIYNMEESSARKIACAHEKLIEKLRNVTVVILYGSIKGEKEKVRATTRGYEELHEQAPRSAFFKVYDVDSQRICLIPTEYTITEVEE